MHWRLKRQLIAVGIVGLVVAIAVFSLFFWFDIAGPLNDETGFVEVPRPLKLLWSRFFLVRQGVYDIAALIENQNEYTKAIAVPYVFRLFDENDILIAAKERVGFMDPGGRFVVVEPLVATGMRAPKRVSFEIRDVIWSAGEKTVLPVVVKQKRFEANETDTTVHVTLANTDVRSSAALEAVAVLADGEGNATAVARAVVDPLMGGEEREVVFTWPSVLPEPNTIQVYVREK